MTLNRIINPLPHNAAFWRTKDRNMWKTLQENEKLLVTSNYSFSHNMFYQYIAHIFHFKRTFKYCLQFVSIWTSLKFCCLVMGYCTTSFL